jgi:SAM-dependent methyltransferase
MPHPTLDPATLRSLDTPVPPEAVRYRVVSSHIDEAFFLESGRLCAWDIIRTLSLAGVEPRGLGRVLDFGCGCSRVLRFLAPALPEAEFHGCDIDEVTIAWSRENVRAAQFAAVPHLPPTAYPDQRFDFIYALSVFSHLDLVRTILWLDELRRILARDGLLLLTVQGAMAYGAVRDTLGQRQQDEFETSGFLFVENIADNVLPDWYQTSIYKERFARLVFQSGFSVLRYEPQGMTRWQDVLLLRKR